jgi:NAD-specific glutamate dehydrogenase
LSRNTETNNINKERRITNYFQKETRKELNNKFSLRFEGKRSDINLEDEQPNA